MLLFENKENNLKSQKNTKENRGEVSNIFRGKSETQENFFFGSRKKKTLEDFL